MTGLSSSRKTTARTGHSRAYSVPSHCYLVCIPSGKNSQNIHPCMLKRAPKQAHNGNVSATVLSPKLTNSWLHLVTVSIREDLSRFEKQGRPSLNGPKNICYSAKIVVGFVGGVGLLPFWRIDGSSPCASPRPFSRRACGISALCWAFPAVACIYAAPFQAAAACRARYFWPCSRLVDLLLAVARFVRSSSPFANTLSQNRNKLSRGYCKIDIIFLY